MCATKRKSGHARDDSKESVAVGSRVVAYAESRTRRGLLPDKDCYDPRFSSGFFLTSYQAGGEEAVSGVEAGERAQIVVGGLIGKEAVCGSGV